MTCDVFNLLRVILFCCSYAGAVPWNCSSTSSMDASSKLLETVLGPQVNRALCGQSPTTSNVDSLLASCKAFCGRKSFPLLIGSPAWGFSQEQMDQICLNATGESHIIHYNRSLAMHCINWAQGMRHIETHAASFIASVENIKLAILQFRVQILTKSNELITSLSSHQSQTVMQQLHHSDRIPYLKKMIKGIVGDGGLKESLMPSLRQLRHQAAELSGALKGQVPQINSFLTQCSRPILAMGPSNEYLLDICSQATDNCIEEAHAAHVGCCCGGIPLAGGGFIPANKPGQQLEVDQALLNSMDVCAEAEAVAESELVSRMSSLQSTPQGESLLMQHLSSLRASYPDFYSRCKIGRKLAKTVNKHKVSMRRMWLATCKVIHCRALPKCQALGLV